MLAFTFFLLMAAQAGAQTGPQHQHEPPPKPAAQVHDHAQMGHDAMRQAREGSGTAWLPDSSPMYAIHKQRGPWELMFHGNGFLQYLVEGSDRGDDQIGSINWVMGMADRQLGPGRLSLRGMFSVEPATIGGCGYPDLLATGELCDGEPIHDRQHQHDLFMEVAALYDSPLRGNLRWQLYGGPAGEPALGPVAYPHRVSAMPNLLAPISHHWLDATHITFGVVTAGVYGPRWKAEGSVFNGREPDEQRTGFDFAPLDSVSGRVWYMPTSALALQVSGGRLNEAEPGHGHHDPRIDVTRLTASATYHHMPAGNRIWASTAAWGRNTELGESTNAFLIETNLTLDDRDSWFGRFEVAAKSAHDLDIHLDDDDALFTVSKFQAGYTRHFQAWQGLRPGLGLTTSLSLMPEALEPFYGTRVSPGVGLYLTLRPSAMRMPMNHGGTPAPVPVPAPSHEQHPIAKPAAEATTQPDPHAGHATAQAAKPAPTPVAADPHAGHTTTPPSRPAATAPAKPADPHAGHGAPAPPRRATRPQSKAAEAHAGHEAQARKLVIFADDPKKLVCATAIDPDNAATTTYKGKAYYFCTSAERLRFISNPETYLKEKGAARGDGALASRWWWR